MPVEYLCQLVIEKDYQRKLYSGLRAAHASFAPPHVPESKFTQWLKNKYFELKKTCFDLHNILNEDVHVTYLVPEEVC